MIYIYDGFTLLIPFSEKTLKINMFELRMCCNFGAITSGSKTRFLHVEFLTGEKADMGRPLCIRKQSSNVRSAYDGK
jgi:hypothetical protein